MFDRQYGVQVVDTYLELFASNPLVMQSTDDATVKNVVECLKRAQASCYTAPVAWHATTLITANYARLEHTTDQ